VVFPGLLIFDIHVAAGPLNAPGGVQCRKFFPGRAALRFLGTLLGAFPVTRPPLALVSVAPPESHLPLPLFFGGFRLFSQPLFFQFSSLCLNFLGPPRVCAGPAVVSSVFCYDCEDGSGGAFGLLVRFGPWADMGIFSDGGHASFGAMITNDLFSGLFYSLSPGRSCPSPLSASRPGQAAPGEYPSP